MTTQKLACFLLIMIAVALTYFGFKIYYRQDYPFCKESTGNMTVKDTLDVGAELKNSTLQHFNSTCQTCKRGVPGVIVQYGPHRTATTLQFHTLCLMMIMLHETEIRNVRCSGDEKPSSNYSVIKTHDMPFHLIASPQNSWVFMTSADGKTTNLKVKRMNDKNIIVRYVADVNLVLKKVISLFTSTSTYLELQTNK